MFLQNRSSAQAAQEKPRRSRGCYRYSKSPFTTDGAGRIVIRVRHGWTLKREGRGGETSEQREARVRSRTKLKGGASPTAKQPPLPVHRGTRVGADKGFAGTKGCIVDVVTYQRHELDLDAAAEAPTTPFEEARTASEEVEGCSGRSGRLPPPSWGTSRNGRSATRRGELNTAKPPVEDPSQLG